MKQSNFIASLVGLLASLGIVAAASQNDWLIDLIHGRRADARDLDWMLHVNPKLKEKGMLVVFNPLNAPVTKTIRVNLYYTDLADSARVGQQHETAKRRKLSRDDSIELPVQVPAQGMNWFVIE